MSQKRTAILRRDNTAETICPHCGETQVFKIETPVRSSTPVRATVRCSCGRAHAVYLERRAFVRKGVDIPGVFRHEGDDSDHSMTIFNLSRTGLKFTADDSSKLEVGDRLRVDFSFGNAQITHIDKRVRVIRVSDEGVGAEFFSGRRAEPLDHVYDLALAMYQP